LPDLCYESKLQELVDGRKIKREVDKMKNFKVVFAVSFEIEAKDENTAMDLAEKKFIEELGKLCLTEIFGVNVEEI